MERLHEHLAIDRWLVTGGSWGSTLALTYAERYPERVTEIVLLAITTSRRSEIDWLYRGSRASSPASGSASGQASPRPSRTATSLPRTRG